MVKNKISEQIARRRIFGIISHPDAGKTTLTEKLLLHGGAIRQAGTVKARKSARYATSDWMEIERQRGISVTSSVMQFEYDDKLISIMDTPGHNDFGEDTYRILTSVDSAVMVIDAAKGIEVQTEKLFAVCRMRHIPVFTFINKLDREARDPLELIGELEDILGMPASAVTWPIGSGLNFQGIYDISQNTLHLYKEKRNLQLGAERVNDPMLEEHLTALNLRALKEEVELLQGAGHPMDEEAVLAGELTPVFFGSALADFGTLPFLKEFLRMSPSPGPRKTVGGTFINPSDSEFSGFVFKIQANMNPAHRDRLAFLRICSGEFERGMSATLHRTGKPLKLSQSTQLMANERENVERALAGDVIGIYDGGNLRVGDTLYTGREPVSFEALPTFPPELFAIAAPTDSMKSKQFQKGVEQLSQEGAIQVYRNEYNEVVLGAVGRLQLEVFEYRLENEYNAPVRMKELDFSIARWVRRSSAEEIKPTLDSRSMLVFDRFERLIILFANRFTLSYYMEKHPKLELAEAMDVKDPIF